MFENLFPIEWSAFHFLRPQFLWLFIPVAFILLLGLLSLKNEIRWKSIIAPHLRPFVIQKGNNHVKIIMNIVLFFSLGFGTLALSGPTWKKKEIPGKELENPLVIILDLSQSMMATDLQPNRLERAKFKITDLLESNPQALIALIGYAGTAHTIVPLTKDYKIIQSHLEGLKPSVMPFHGSNLSSAIELADSLMSVTSAPGTVLIFTDDIENNDFTTLQNFTQISNRKIILIPVNTKHGSEVPSFNGKGSLKDNQRHVVYSSLNEAVLDKAYSVENISVQQLTLDKSDMELINKQLSKDLIFKEKNEEKEDDWRDAGFMFIIPMALLLLLWFRKGWVIYTIPLCLMASCKENSTFADLWFTKDYQGQQLMNKQNYAEAANRFTDPMHKGVASFKAGNYEDAIEAFKQDTTAKGAYNLGLAYLSNGDTAAAFSAFGNAEELNPELQAATEAQHQLSKMMEGTSNANPEEAQEEQPEQTAENKQNDSPEDLSGGGQEATKKDMQKQRNEETVNTDIHKVKELDEVPDDMQVAIQKQDNSKILMRKVDDDPSLFLQKKFKYQVKKEHIKPKADEKTW